MLTSKCLKGVSVGYPLKLVANEVKQTQVEFNNEFVQRIIPKLDWPVLCEAAKTLGIDGLPVEAPSSDTEEDIMKKVHHALFEVEVVQGELICPETGRKFPIRLSIPNMLCNEDEI
jgi:multifunctional methyltransferase subunit TRM112